MGFFLHEVLSISVSFILYPQFSFLYLSFLFILFFLSLSSLSHIFLSLILLIYLFPISHSTCLTSLFSHSTNLSVYQSHTRSIFLFPLLTIYLTFYLISWYLSHNLPASLSLRSISLYQSLYTYPFLLCLTLTFLSVS